MHFETWLSFVSGHKLAAEGAGSMKVTASCAASWPRTRKGRTAENPPSSLLSVESRAVRRVVALPADAFPAQISTSLANRCATKRSCRMNSTVRRCTSSFKRSYPGSSKPMTNAFGPAFWSGPGFIRCPPMRGDCEKSPHDQPRSDTTFARGALSCALRGGSGVLLIRGSRVRVPDGPPPCREVTSTNPGSYAVSRPVFVWLPLAPALRLIEPVERALAALIAC